MPGNDLIKILACVLLAIVYLKDRFFDKISLPIAWRMTIDKLIYISFLFLMIAAIYNVTRR